MNRKKISIFITFVVLSVLILNFASFAFGESTTHVKTLSLTIMPEYDKANSVYLEYDGQLASDQKTPASISFDLPKDVDENSMHTCAITAKGEHQCQLRQKSANGNSTKFTYNSPLPHIVTQAYYNPIDGQGDSKSFEYTYKSTMNVDELTIAAQQPLKATDFKVTPSAQSNTTDQKGFKYAVYNYKNVKPGDTFKVKIAYTKTDSNPSVQGNGQSSSPTSSSSTGTSSGLSVGVVLGIITALIVAGGGGFYVANNMGKKPSTSSYQPPKKKPRPVASGNTQFCTSCGTQVKAGDNFCPSCGKRKP